mgnify:CR=1 FL=1
MEGCNVWSEQSRVHLDAWMLGCLDAARMLECLASSVWVQHGYMLTLPPMESHTMLGVVVLSAAAAAAAAFAAVSVVPYTHLTLPTNREV